MPDYGAMPIHALNRAMAAYGLKRRPTVAAMAAKLREIWVAVNGGSGDAEGGATDVAMGRVAPLLTQPLSQPEADEPRAPPPTAKPRKRKATGAAAADASDGDSTQDNAGDLSAQVRDAIARNRPLYESLLCFEAVTLHDIAAAVAAAGVKFTKVRLRDFLDSEGVTFVVSDGAKTRAAAAAGDGRPPKARR
eukprot:TRINITY_DN26943_c0_g1_i1.p1 TRINITY_DN26943_c0_g1~~TRINITY_DN26943_c0_g1_i1.p1  ORF type:complete len:192 (+),score=59.28 TRINITY_DN26943_c0_g1_i1:133-708(+)